MRISILQLSDIHFKSTNNSVIEKIDKMFNAIKNEIDNSNYLFITFTGDIAFSGKKEEYLVAESFLENLTSKISSYKEIDIKYVFTAGNHDCDFSDDGIRDILINSVLDGTKEITNAIIENCTKIQKNYFEFIKKYNSDIVIESNIFSRYEYNIDSHKIAFNSYNLAWASKKKEVQANIIYPSSILDKNNISNENFDITISIFHHPLHWLQHDNIRQFKELINSTSNIVMTGHEHTFSAKKESPIDTLEHIEYIEAGTLQDSSNQDNSSFNLLIIDLQNNKQDILEFYFKSDMYIKKSSCYDITLPFNKKSIFKLKETYKDLLNTMGLKVTHPYKSNLLLEDIFIYPELQIINDSSAKNSFIQVNSDIFKQKDKIGFTIIYGAETSGKTSLSRMLQLKYKRDGLIPILITGKDIKSNDIHSKKIKQLISKVFKNQYETTQKTISEFEQIDKNQILLFIDDFNNANLNSDYKALFINKLKKLNYQNILILSHESLQLEATTEGDLAKSLIDFKHYLLIEFGHSLRETLIKKWILIGKQSTINKNDLVYKTREKADSINKTIGYNIVPSYPIYLLTLLQAMEANETSSLAKSSYGYYYEFLIMKYLNANSPMEPKDITTIFTYTSTFAYKCLIEKTHIFNEDDLSTFKRTYCQEKRFTPRFDINKKLIESNILSVYEDEYKFSHDYIYYFFVAKYLSDNITKEEIKDIIQKLCKRLYRIEFANIIMFLIHHSPQDFILETIINEAKGVLEDIKEFTFASDELKNINDLIKQEKLQLESRTLEESRKIELDEKDKNTHHAKKVERLEADFNEDIKKLDQFATLNLAFKIIEILGEITKNYAGSLDGNIKYELIKETYSIGLRSLKSLIEFFEVNHELLTKEIKKMILKKHYVTEDKISKTVANMIFSMASSISTGIVKKIAKAIASRELQEIYQSILNERKDNNAIKLINSAISLDFKGGLDVSKLEEIHKDLTHNNNRLADSVLKRIILEHIYMFEIEFNKKQSICSKFDIDSNNSKKEMIKHIKK
jgi:hypothetical protein